MRVIDYGPLLPTHTTTGNCYTQYTYQLSAQSIPFCLHSIPSQWPHYTHVKAGYYLQFCVRDRFLPFSIPSVRFQSPLFVIRFLFFFPSFVIIVYTHTHTHTYLTRVHGRIEIASACFI